MNRIAQRKDDGVLKNKIAVPVYDGNEFFKVYDTIYCQRDNR